MTRTSLLASVAIAAMVGHAAAQQANQGFIGQIDESNFAYLSQNAGGALQPLRAGNEAFIYQNGTGNVFLPLTATGDRADAQTGNNSLGVIQNGTSNIVGGSFFQTSVGANGNDGGIAQFGNKNVVDVFEQTGGNRGTVFQSGDNNLARNVQENGASRNDAGIIQLGTEGSTGAYNFASTAQTGTTGGAFAGIASPASPRAAPATRR
jgi:trimeric autotransporter adhesin